MGKANVQAIENIIRGARTEQVAELIGKFVDQMLDNIHDANVETGELERHIEHAEHVGDTNSMEYWCERWNYANTKMHSYNYALEVFCHETLGCDLDAITTW